MHFTPLDSSTGQRDTAPTISNQRLCWWVFLIGSGMLLAYAVSGLIENKITTGEIIAVVFGIVVLGIPFIVRWWRKRHPVLIDLSNDWSDRYFLMTDKGKWSKSLTIKRISFSPPLAANRSAIACRGGSEQKPRPEVIGIQYFIATDRRIGCTVFFSQRISM